MPEKKPITKAQLISALAQETGVDKKDVTAVYEALGVVIDREIRDGVKEFKLLNRLKVVVKDVPAREAKTGVPNPFKPGETMDLPAKPASKKIRVTPLKALKQLV